MPYFHLLLQYCIKGHLDGFPASAMGLELLQGSLTVLQNTMVREGGTLWTEERAINTCRSAAICVIVLSYAKLVEQQTQPIRTY